MSSSAEKFKRNARGFTKHLSSLLTTTITYHPLTFIPKPNVAFVSFRGTERFGESASADLGNGCSVRISQIIMPHKSDPDKVTTTWYSYSYALGPDHDRDWLVRYDYVPLKAIEDDYEYPSAHLHFNGHSEAYESFDLEEKKALHKLHFPSKRISLEDFIEHLIVEFGLLPEGEKHEAVRFLEESRSTFEEKKRTR